MNNSESTYENGRYVWSAILIILAVILAAIAFVTWIVDAGGNETVKSDVPSDGYANTSLKSKKDTDNDQRYGIENDRTNSNIEKNTDIENNSEPTDNNVNNGYYADTVVDENDPVANDTQTVA